MKESRTLLIRGLEYPLVVEFSDTYDKFEISSIFTTFGKSISSWCTDYESLITTMERNSCDEFLISQCSSTEKIFHRIQFFRLALEYCSEKGCVYSDQIVFYLTCLKITRDIQWVEKELYRILHSKEDVQLPVSEELLTLRQAHERLQGRFAVARAKRKRGESSSTLTERRTVTVKRSAVSGDVESAARSAERIMMHANSHIVIIPITKPVVSNDEEEVERASPITTP